MVTASTWGTSTKPKPPPSPKRYSVGVDLGQASDYTAIAVLEKALVPPKTAAFSPVGNEPGNRLVEGDAVFDLIYLKRPKLGTPYDVIAARVADLVTKLEPKGAFGEIGQISLSVDGTGVGRGIVDMLRSEFGERKARGEYIPRIDFRPVTVTGGSSRMQHPKTKNDYWSVPKKDLVFPAVAAFQQHRVRVASGLDAKDRDALIHELKNYRRVTNIATGGMQFEPWRESDHDDLLFALSLALWGWQVQAPRRSLRVVA